MINKIMEEVGMAEIIDKFKIYAILNVIDGKQQADYYRNKIIASTMCRVHLIKIRLFTICLSQIYSTNIFVCNNFML